MSGITFYIIVILAVVLGIYLFKKFVGCMVRIAITVVILGILAAVYFAYFG